MKIINPIIFLVTFSVFICLKLYEYYAKYGVCDDRTFILCNFYMSDIVRVSNFIFILTAFSALLFFLPKQYFESWLRFAWWGGLVVIGTIVYLHAFLTRQPGDMFADIFDRPVTWIAYTFFVIGSLIQLWRVYRTPKHRSF